MKKLVGVRGYFGMGNFGDEIMLDTWRQILPDATVFMDYYFMNMPGKTVFVGGGDIVNLYEGCPYFTKDLLRTPFAVFGVGVENSYPPNEHGIAALKSYADAARFFGVRDQESVNLLAIAGISATLMPDMVHLYEPSYRMPLRFKPRRTCGMVVYQYDDLDRAAVGDVTAHLIGRGYDIVFIPVVDGRNPFSDRPVVAELSDRFGTEHSYVMPMEFPNELKWNAIQSLDLLVSFKMHPALCALRGGVPTVCSSRYKKVRAMMEDFGAGDLFIPFDRFGVASVDAAVDRIEAGREALVQTLRDHGERQNRLAREALDRLRHAMASDDPAG